MTLDTEEQVDLAVQLMDVGFYIGNLPIELLLELTEIFGLEVPQLNPFQFDDNVPQPKDGLFEIVYQGFFPLHLQDKTRRGLLLYKELHGPIGPNTFPILFLVVRYQGLQDEEQQIVGPLFSDDPLIVKNPLADPIKMVPFLFLYTPNKVLGHHEEHLLGFHVLVLRFDDPRRHEQLILELND